MTTRQRFGVLALLSVFLSLPAFAGDKKIELLGAFSFNDARHSEYRDIQGSVLAEFPLTKNFSVGPVAQYNYIRQEATETVTTITVPSETWAPTPDPAVTTTRTHGNTTEVWSIGGRAVFHLTPTHNGLYFAGEVTMPQKDADGYIVTPEAGFQWSMGRALGRVAYRHAFQRNDDGDTIDLEGDAVTFAFGAAF